MSFKKIKNIQIIIIKKIVIIKKKFKFGLYTIFSHSFPEFERKLVYKKTKVPKYFKSWLAGTPNFR